MSDILFDIKVVFKMEYKTFKGTISLVFTLDNQEEDELQIFNPEIKRGGLIYL